MANRLSIIATRTGDDGTTGLGDGSRTGKDTLRIAALGDIDELNSAIGVALAEPTINPPLVLDMRVVQSRLFDIGAELCIPGHTALQAQDVAQLDEFLAHYNAALPPLREFILPGGTRPGALLHLARAICRRAERTVVALGREATVNAPVLQYLNRLSDLLFVMARRVNADLQVPDLYWTGPNARDTGPAS